MADQITVVIHTSSDPDTADPSLSEATQLSANGVDVTRITRSDEALERALEDGRPDVVIIDTDLPDQAGFKAIGDTLGLSPGVGVLIRTPSPVPHDHVARALRAGAVGFISKEQGAAIIAPAVRAVAGGQPWLPPEVSREVFASVGDERVLTAADREARLRNFVLGLIPLTGGVTAVMSLLWRTYLGQIGVRPVDLAIDPTTRIVDAIFAVSVLIGVFGPLLFIGSWLDLLQESSHRGVRRWLAAHRRTARLLLTFSVISVFGTLAGFAQILVALFVGPIVAGLLVAKIFDIDDDLPRALRPTRLRPSRTVIGALAILIAGITVLSAEILVIGPDLGPNGAQGIIAPTVMGFRAQPMRAIDVDGERAPREVLYLGGNADLYVLVDPCNDDEVEFVSVGSSRLIVIDEVTC